MLASSKESHKKSLLILCFVSFLGWLSYGLVYPVFAVSIFHHDPIFSFISMTGKEGMWLGILLASSPLAQFFSSPLIGLLSDYRGRKCILQITSLIMLFGYLISAYGLGQHSLFFLIAGRIVTGVGAGNIVITNSSIADITEPRLRAKNFAYITLANGLGFAIGPFLSGNLSQFGLAVPFLFGAVLTALCFLFLCFGFSETHQIEKTNHRFSLRHLFRSVFEKRFLSLFLAFLLFCFGWSFYWEFMPVIWIKDYKQTLSQIGDFYAYASACYVIASYFIIRYILKMFSGPYFLFCNLLLLGISFFFLPGVNIKAYWIWIAVQQFFIAMIFPTATAIVSNQTTDAFQGEMLGVFQALQSFAFSMTPLLGGWILDLNHDTPIIIGGAAIILSALLFLILHLTYKKCNS